MEDNAKQTCCQPKPHAGQTASETVALDSRLIAGWVETPVGSVARVKTDLGTSDILGRWRMRWGMGRQRYRVAPGLYAAGTPDADSPVLVSANYKMSFDALRAALPGLDAWIVVLDTDGINVWCAAGKGTFGTDEVVRRVKATGIAQIVNHRKLVLPQLAGPGVAAHRVQQECGFTVVYGPVHARDLPGFLAAGMRATPEMRRVTFSTLERLALTPVEIVGALKPMLWMALPLFLLAGLGPAFFSPAAAWHRGIEALTLFLGATLAGAVVTPALLPWLPWRAFSAKGALIGAVGACLAGIASRSTIGALEWVAVMLALPALASFVAMNFTGATPFTSPSGVEKEMRRAIPVQLLAVTVAAIAWVGSAFAR